MHNYCKLYTTTSNSSAVLGRHNLSVIQCLCMHQRGCPRSSLQGKKPPTNISSFWWRGLAGCPSKALGRAVICQYCLRRLQGGQFPRMENGLGHWWSVVKLLFERSHGGQATMLIKDSEERRKGVRRSWFVRNKLACLQGESLTIQNGVFGTIYDTSKSWKTKKGKRPRFAAESAYPQAWRLRKTPVSSRSCGVPWYPVALMKKRKENKEKEK